MSKQILPISHPKQLKEALATIDTFTQKREDGREAPKSPDASLLKTIKSLAKSYIVPLFSSRTKQQKKEKELYERKKALLQARDHIQSCSSLIQKYQTGSEAQRLLAELAIASIERYNNLLTQSRTKQKATLSDELGDLLKDSDITEHPIELSMLCKREYHSDPSSLKGPSKLAFEALDNFGKELTKEETPSKKEFKPKTKQFVIEAFWLKATRLIEQHLKRPMAEILPFVKETLPHLEESDSEIVLKQLISFEAGASIIVTGSFKKNSSALHLATIPMPIADSFQLSSQFVHNGFPYPCQHNGWGLSWPEALPLRKNQTPIFQELNEKRKALISQFLLDEPFHHYIRKLFKAKKECFDQHKHFFIDQHRQLMETLYRLSEGDLIPSSFDAFYSQARQAPSSFEFLTKSQEKLVHLFIQAPRQALEEEWMENEEAALRAEDKGQRALAAKQLMLNKIRETKEKWTLNGKEDPFLKWQGALLGKLFIAISLQGQSEKMAFSPIQLTSLERRLQVLAFEQQQLFFEQCQQSEGALHQENIKHFLESSWERALSLLCHPEESSSRFAIAHELKRYFDSRLDTSYPPLGKLGS